MTKFSNRIKKSSSDSSIILANDYSTNVPRLESKTIHNIKSLHKNLCAIKINFHLLLKLGKKEIQKINKTANNYGLQTIADIKLNDIGNTNLVAIENLDELGFDAVETRSMFKATCSIDGQWSGGSLVPYGTIELSPSKSVTLTTSTSLYSCLVTCSTVASSP